MEDIFKIRKTSNRMVEEALDRLDEEGIALHSFLVAYKNEVIAERYYKPYKRDDVHRLYSVTKSINALAIGILLKKGMLSLDDRLDSIFPEYISSEVDERVKRTSVRNLLMMKSPYSRTCYKGGAKNGNNVSQYQKDWVKSFFVSTPDHDPDTFFSYDTGAATLLSKIVEKVSGMNYIDFLRSEMFSKLGVSDDAYILADPSGNPQGGSGLFMRPIDLLKIIYMVKEGGLGLIDESYLTEAVAPLSDTTIASLGNMKERRMGYGYQIWSTGNGSYAFIGLGGQFALAVPEKDLVFVTTADTQVYDPYSAVILKTLLSLASVIDPSAEVEGKERSVISLSSTLPCPLSGREYEIDQNGIGLSRFSISFTSDGGLISLLKNGIREEYPFSFSSNRMIDLREKSSSPALSSASYNRDGTLSVWIQFIGECQGGLTFEISMKGDRISFRMHLFGELMFDGYNGVFTGTAV